MVNTKEKFVEKVKGLAVDYWTMGIHGGTFESHFRDLLEEYENKSEVPIEKVVSDILAREVEFEGVLEHNNKTYQVSSKKGVVKFKELGNGSPTCYVYFSEQA